MNALVLVAASCVERRVPALPGAVRARHMRADAHVPVERRGAAQRRGVRSLQGLRQRNHHYGQAAAGPPGDSRLPQCRSLLAVRQVQRYIGPGILYLYSRNRHSCPCHTTYLVHLLVNRPIYNVRA